MMIIGPHNIDGSTVWSIRLINGYPGLITKNLICPGFKDAYWIPKRFTAIVGFRDGYTTFALIAIFIIENSRVDIIVISKSEADVRSRFILLETRQNTTIGPGATTIKRAIVSYLKSVMSFISKEFRASHKIERIFRILCEHRLTMGKVRIMAHMYICKRCLSMLTRLHAVSTPRNRVSWNRRWCRSN